MLFLFNDIVLEIEPPAEAIRSETFPIKPQVFDTMHISEITHLACEEVFNDLMLPRTQPQKAKQLAMLLASKSGANAALVGAPAQGAKRPIDMGVRLAEVSLMTMSNLYQMQCGGTLSANDVHASVWQSLAS